MADEPNTQQAPDETPGESVQQVEVSTADGDQQPEATAEPLGEPLDLPSFDDPGATSQDTTQIGFLGDVNLHVKVELGRSRMYVEDVLRLNEGSVVELDKPAGDPVDIYVNDRHLARGEVLVVNDNFCVRVSEIVAMAEAEEPVTAQE